MSDVSTWNPLDSANTAAPPDGWPEFMMPSMVNNSARAMMGAVRRMYDEMVAGSLVLPYLKLSGGTVTGGVTITGNLNVATISASSTIFAGGNISTGGALSASGQVSGGSVTSANNIFASGIINTNLRYDVSGAVALSRFDASSIALADASGQWCALLRTNGENWYGNNKHQFVSRNNGAAYGYIDAGGLTLQGSGGITAPGSANIGGNFTANGYVAASGPIYGAGRFIYCGPAAEGMALVNDAGANRKYLQFVAGWALVHDTTSGRAVFAGVPGEIWAMEPAGFCYANLAAVGGHGGYVDLSDAELKEQIEPATQGLAEILQLQPKTFVRKPRIEGAPQRQELGFVAQEVQQALPLAVVEVEQPDGPLLGVTSEAIVAALVAAIKTIDQRLTAGGL